MLLNDQALEVLEEARRHARAWRLQWHDLAGGGQLVDAGLAVPGSLAAGLWLARLCLAGLGEVSLVPGPLGPSVQVWTDQPATACLAAQYAGWRLAHGKFFALGSGPMRAAAAKEPLFNKLGIHELPVGVVGILESRLKPPPEIIEQIATVCQVPADGVHLAIAPTASFAGTVQVVARSVETALHKLLELGFDVTRVKAGYGVAPLPPVGGDDLAAMGLTNDAILYGGQVTLWLEATDEEIAELGPRLPSSSSPQHGRRFLDLFEAAGRDFYQMDPLLFSPAEVTLRGLHTGREQIFGAMETKVLRRSFRPASS